MTPFVEFIIKYAATITFKGVWRCSCSSAQSCEACPNRAKSLLNCDKITEDELNYLHINHPELFI